MTRKKEAQRREGKFSFVFGLLFLSILLFPHASDWVSQIRFNTEISGYTESVSELAPDKISKMIQEAREYNSSLPLGQIQDPFSFGPDHKELLKEEAKIYNRLLRVRGSSAMGIIDYSKLGIRLPIYHGTSDEVLRAGVGHVFGSSLPVGGKGTHAVLTSHSGLARASLFTPLLQAKKGQHFSVTALGRTRQYKVKSVTTVLPENVESLAVDPDKEYVTLITCAPLGINSHRVLVLGEYVGDKGVGPASSGEVTGKEGVWPFPWWLIIWLTGALLLWFLLTKKRKTPPDFYLSSPVDPRLSEPLACWVTKKVMFDRHASHGLLVTCSPALKGDDLGYAKGIEKLILVNSLEEDDLWDLDSFPVAVQVTLADQWPNTSPDFIGQGEIRLEKDQDLEEESG